MKGVTPRAFLHSHTKLRPLAMTRPTLSLWRTGTAKKAAVCACKEQKDERLMGRERPYCDSDPKVRSDEAVMSGRPLREAKKGRAQSVCGTD